MGEGGKKVTEAYVHSNTCIIEINIILHTVINNHTCILLQSGDYYIVGVNKPKLFPRELDMQAYAHSTQLILNDYYFIYCFQYNII